MRVFLVIIALVTLQNLAKASDNNFYAEQFDTNSVEYKELSRMSADQNKAMSSCVADMVEESQASVTEYEADESEVVESCINDVLGDIHS